MNVVRRSAKAPISLYLVLTLVMISGVVWAQHNKNAPAPSAPAPKPPSPPHQSAPPQSHATAPPSNASHGAMGNAPHGGSPAGNNSAHGNMNAPGHGNSTAGGTNNAHGARHCRHRTKPPAHFMLAARDLTTRSMRTKSIPLYWRHLRHPSFMIPIL